MGERGGSRKRFIIDVRKKEKKMGRLRKKEQKVEERKKNVQKEGSVSVRVCGPCGGVGWWT